MSNEGMDAESFEQFIAQLDRYVRERLIPAERETIEGDAVPPAILAEMRAMGLFGLTVPEAYGGAGLNTSQYARVVRSMAYAAPAFRSIFSINVGMFNSAIKTGGTEAQKAEWWPRIAAGEIACFGLTEPDAGSDPAGMKTRAEKVSDGYRLTGSKMWISNAPIADVFVVWAKSDAHGGGIRGFVLEKGM